MGRNARHARRAVVRPPKPRRARPSARRCRAHAGGRWCWRERRRKPLLLAEDPKIAEVQEQRHERRGEDDAVVHARPLRRLRHHENCESRGDATLIHIQLGPPAGPRTSTSTGPGGPHIHIHARGLHIHHIQRQNGRIALEISKFSSDSRLAQSAALAAPSALKGSEFANFSPAALTAANRQKSEIPGTKSVFWRGVRARMLDNSVSGKRY